MINKGLIKHNDHSFKKKKFKFYMLKWSPFSVLCDSPVRTRSSK